MGLRNVLENIGGAARIAGCLVLRPLVKQHYSRWGATSAELRQVYPGDERVPCSLATQTLAVTIRTRANEIWPWIAQIGQERGGLCSYELLENLVGCHMHNADHIVADWELHVGDTVRFGPPGYPVQKVIGLERGHWLLLAGADLKTAQVTEPADLDPARHINATWCLYLSDQPDGTTRLISRSRLDYAPRNFVNKLMWEWTTDPIGFVMTRKMLLGIKDRAKRLQ